MAITTNDLYGRGYASQNDERRAYENEMMRRQMDAMKMQAQPLYPTQYAQTQVGVDTPVAIEIPVHKVLLLL